MNRRRPLQGIEQDLAASDPCLDKLFLWFTIRARGEKMPSTEKIRRRPLRLLPPPGMWAACLREAEDWPIWPRAIP